MVSTRSSSSRIDTPSATPTPTRRSGSSKPKSSSPSSPSSPNGAKASSSAWSHAPDRLTLAWLAISLPLVTWDTLYIFGRPATMPGGSLHWPLWQPYALYGQIDLVYGWPAWEARDGFTAAQGFLNVVETAMYLYYLWAVYNGGAWRVGGIKGGRATLVGFAAAVMTLSKTALYWLQEVFGEYKHIGHNGAADLILLWVIPK